MRAAMFDKFDTDPDETPSPAPALPVPMGPRALADDMRAPLVAGEQRDLLCALAYVALGVGDGVQAVTLLDLVLREVPGDAGATRLMAYARVAIGDGDGALAALDRLEELEAGEPPAPLLLLRSQALRLAGRLDEGRTTFRRFVAVRRARETTR